MYESNLQDFPASSLFSNTFQDLEKCGKIQDYKKATTSLEKLGSHCNELSKMITNLLTNNTALQITIIQSDHQ